ncbi:MAG: hypothetical protein M1827_001696 [Pycnora praestabilis]|nr:MAG: hypothetical protein M1827_001696 [Pycnora praestabilis]
MSTNPTLGTSAPKKIPILLLKTKSTPNDGYEEYFNGSRTFAPRFVPVLEHRYNEGYLGKVKDLLLSGAFSASVPEYGGLIFTSQRAVEGFIGVVQQVLESTHLLSLTPTLLSPRTPLYTVGPATSRALSSTPSLDPSSIHGADTGNGESLAKFILQHYPSTFPFPPRPSCSSGPSLPSHAGDNSVPNTRANTTLPPLLFLVGEQRRDIIPRTLSSSSLPPAQRIGVDELIVYETREMASFARDFSAELERNNRGEDGRVEDRNGAGGEGEGEEGGSVRWVVVFSPTGCEAMLRCLGLIPSRSASPPSGASLTQHNVPTSSSGIMQSRKATRKTFVATIGPTTRDYLIREFGYEPDVCAQRPCPEGVGEGIALFQRGIGDVRAAGR